MNQRSDIVTQRKRSEMMAAVSQEDTPPEMAVRSILTSLGCRYRVRNRDLLGSPDIANRTRGWAVFVHGCFWHGHNNCPHTRSGRDFRVPASNAEFWREKLETNRLRDARAITSLLARDFVVALVWECELKNPKAVADRLAMLIPSSDESPSGGGGST